MSNETGDDKEHAVRVREVFDRLMNRLQETTRSAIAATPHATVGGTAEWYIDGADSDAGVQQAVIRLGTPRLVTTLVHGKFRSIWQEQWFLIVVLHVVSDKGSDTPRHRFTLKPAGHFACEGGDSVTVDDVIEMAAKWLAE